MLCALCALGFKKDGKVRKLERYITRRSIPVWVLTSRGDGGGANSLYKVNTDVWPE